MRSISFLFAWVLVVSPVFAVEPLTKEQAEKQKHAAEAILNSFSQGQAPEGAHPMAEEAPAVRREGFGKIVNDVGLYERLFLSNYKHVLEDRVSTSPDLETAASRAAFALAGAEWEERMAHVTFFLVMEQAYRAYKNEEAARERKEGDKFVGKPFKPSEWAGAGLAEVNELLDLVEHMKDFPLKDQIEDLKNKLELTAAALRGGIRVPSESMDGKSFSLKPLNAEQKAFLGEPLLKAVNDFVDPESLWTWSRLVRKYYLEGGKVPDPAMCSCEVIDLLPLKKLSPQEEEELRQRLRGFTESGASDPVPEPPADGPSSPAPPPADPGAVKELGSQILEMLKRLESEQKNRK